MKRAIETDCLNCFSGCGPASKREDFSSIVTTIAGSLRTLSFILNGDSSLVSYGPPGSSTSNVF